MDVRVGLLRKLSTEELMLFNCSVGEDSWMSFALQGEPVNLKGNQPRIFIRSTSPEAEAPVLWSTDMKSWPIGKDPDAEKNWRPEEKEMTEDEMLRRHHWISGHEFEKSQGDSDRQRSLACNSSWSHKESDMTCNWTTATGITKG